MRSRAKRPSGPGTLELLLRAPWATMRSTRSRRSDSYVTRASGIEPTSRRHFANTSASSIASDAPWPDVVGEQRGELLPPRIQAGGGPLGGRDRSAWHVGEPDGAAGWIDEITEERVRLRTDPRGPVNMATHPKLRRWDTPAPGSLTVMIAAGDAAWIPLEAGIEVTFQEGSYRTGDYWLIPARTATQTIEWPPYEIPNATPEAQPALGVRHHLCRLALITRDKDTNRVSIQDCRTLFRPLATHALQVVRTSWNNDDALAVDQLERGLVITLSAAPDRRTVSSDTLIVTLEAPERVDNPNSGMDVAISYILNGKIEVQETVITWTPDASSSDALRKVAGSHVPARVRVVLKGHVIWRQTANQRLYLDGQAFGETIGGPRAALTRTGLIYPTGNGARASDFESWFRLEASK